MGKLFTGYMVVWRNGDPLWLDRYGILWGSTGRRAPAIFKNRAAAERAISKTLGHRAYAVRSGWVYRAPFLGSITKEDNMRCKSCGKPIAAGEYCSTVCHQLRSTHWSDARIRQGKIGWRGGYIEPELMRQRQRDAKRAARALNMLDK